MTNDAIDFQDTNAQVTNYKTVVYIICIIAALGGLLFGLDQGFIANSLPTIQTHYNLNLKRAQTYSSIMPIGCIIGTLLAGLFARFLGRKKSLILAGFTFSVASLTSTLLPPIQILCICRFFLGIAIGTASFIVPLYLSETAPTQIRGSMGTLFQLMVSIGIFLISVTNVAIVKIISSPGNALSLMFLVEAIFALVMFISAFVLPESPRWLMLKGKKHKAIVTLKKTLNTQKEIDFEINEIETTLSSPKNANISVIFKGYFLKILIIGIALQFFQQFIGINVMIYYAPTIFGYANLKGFIAMMIVPTVNMLFTFPAVKLVEKWGRKKLLYIGASFTFVTMFTAGSVFYSISNIHNVALIGPTPKLILLFAVIIYIIGFAVSWGPVVWLICSEIFPLEGREVGVTITTMANWTFTSLLTGNILSIMQKCGNASVFYLFSFLSILAVLVVVLFVPETKGITLEKLEANLKAGKKLRHLGV